MRLIILFLLFFSLYFNSVGIDNTNDFNDEKKQTFMFANKLFENNEYYQAAGEYQRFSYLYPKDQRSELCDFMQAYCYYRGKEFNQSNKLLQAFLGHFPNTKYKDLVLLLSVGNMIKNSWDDVDFDMLSNNFDKSSAAYQLVLYLNGWHLLEKGEWSAGCAQMQKVAEIDTILNFKNAANKIATLLLENPPLKIISYKKVMNLSKWLPGAGQWSLGNHVDGVKSFLITSGVTYVAYDWFASDFILGGAFMFYQGTMRFHKGGKYNAAEQALNQNDKIINNVITPLYNKYYPWNILDLYLLKDILNQEQTKQ